MKDRVRLLFTDDNLPAGGGKETLLLTHLVGLDRRQFDVDVVMSSNKGELIPKAQEFADNSAVFDRKVGLDPYVIWK